MFSFIIALLALFAPNGILELSVKEVAEKLGSSGLGGGLAVGGTVLGVTSLCLHLACIIDKRKKLLTSHLEALRTELRKVKTDYEIMKRDIEEQVTKRMK